MEFGGIQFQKIRLVIVSGIIRFSWTLIILVTGIILLVQETNKIFGDWENSYWPFGTLFVILSGYGIFRYFNHAISNNFTCKNDKLVIHSLFWLLKPNFREIVQL